MIPLASWQWALVLLSILVLAFLVALLVADARTDGRILRDRPNKDDPAATESADNAASEG